MSTEHVEKEVSMSVDSWTQNHPDIEIKQILEKIIPVGIVLIRDPR